MGGPDQAAAASAVAHCISDIEVADFIALDLEFSGLFTDVERGDKRPLNWQDYFKKCIQSVPQFLPLQLGVCCGRLKPQQTTPGVAAWELRAHEFNMWPQERRLFVSDLQSLRFLRSHGFDFNAFFEQAHSYTRLPAAENAEALKKLPPSHATRILSAIREAKVPVVVHNGLLDLLHLHDKFLGDLPDSGDAFGKSWVSHFPLLFDTRYIAQEGRFLVLKHSGGLSLEVLHKHLSSMPNCVASSPESGGGGAASGAKGVRLERSGPLLEGAKRTAHGSSAFDATMTAEVFILETDLWLRSAADGAATGPDRKRRRKTTQVAQAAENDDDGGWTVVGKKQNLDPGEAVAAAAAASGFSSASLMESHDVCRRFHNRLAIVGSSPGCLDMGRPFGMGGLGGGLGAVPAIHQMAAIGSTSAA